MYIETCSLKSCSNLCCMWEQKGLGANQQVQNQENVYFHLCFEIRRYRQMEIL